MPAAEIFYGASTIPVALTPERRTTNPVGWDSLKRTYLLDSEGDLETALAAFFPEGGAHPTHSQMFIERTDPVHQGSGIYEIAVDWKGILNEKGYRRTVKVFGETSTGENIASTLGGGYPSFIKKIKVEQPLLSVEYTYMRTGLPSFAQVKAPVVTLPSGLPALPTPPAQVWTSIADPTYIYPAGWILDSRDPKQLNTTDLYLVTDRYVFRHMTEM